MTVKDLKEMLNEVDENMEMDFYSTIEKKEHVHIGIKVKRGMRMIFNAFESGDKCVLSIDSDCIEFD